MAHDAFTVGMLFLLCGIMFFLGTWWSKEKIDVEGRMKLYREGWDDAKQLYYTDRRAAEIAEMDRERAAAAKENTDTSRITPELLMAYGVNSVAQLPRQVREQYNFSPEEYGIDLDMLLDPNKPQE